MNEEAILLDRDGTITKPGDHIHKIADLEFLPYAIEGLKKLQEFGYKLIIITNQAGIGRGLYTEEDYFIFKNEMYRRLENEGIFITAEYFCPHHPEKGIGKYKIDCNCRKPKTGMLEKAIKDFSLDVRKCWLIGDNLSDILAGRGAGCRTIHVLTGECKIPITYADFIASDLVNAADYIIKDKKNIKTPYTNFSYGRRDRKEEV